jgi:DNA-binding MarR family transcriptional regulator
MRLKYLIGNYASTLDPFIIAVDAVSAIVLVILVLIAAKAVHAFKQSKQALMESASIISVIVDALTSRIAQSEFVLSQAQTEVDGLKTRIGGVEWEEAELRSSSLQLLKRLEEVLSNDKRLVVDLENLKARVASLPPIGTLAHPLAKRMNLAGVVSEGDILSPLTPTERETLMILNVEGSKAAPELGQRLRKSREHTSRLMKKLYLEGYVDRESNRAPFRYKLSETARSALQPAGTEVTEKESEKA